MVCYTNYQLQNNTNSIRLLNAAMVNGYSIVTYQRPLKASDELDKQILTNQSQAVIWAIGPLNQRLEVSFHSHYTKGDRFIDFGRPAKWNCPMPEGETTTKSSSPAPSRVVSRTTTTTTEAEVSSTAAPTRARDSSRRRGEASRGTRRQQEITPQDSEDSASQPARSRHQAERRGVSRGNEKNSIASSVAKPVPTPAPVTNRDAWEIPPIQCYEPEDGVFYAQMGPTGGKRGYPAITGKSLIQLIIQHNLTALCR